MSHENSDSILGINESLAPNPTARALGHTLLVANDHAGEAMSETPEDPHMTITQLVDSYQDHVTTPELKSRFIDDLTQSLNAMTHQQSYAAGHNVRNLFREYPLDEDGLGIDYYTAQQAPDWVKHSKILDFLDSHGIATDEQERAFIRTASSRYDTERRLRNMGSFAEHGLLTFADTVEKSITSDTSATPNDVYGAQPKATDAILGYDIHPDETNIAKWFTDAQGFYYVGMERGWEAMSSTASRSEVEITDRLINTMLFMVPHENIESSTRTLRRETAVHKSIPPEKIAYVLVDETNVPIAVDAFKDTPVRIVGVPRKSIKITLQDSPKDFTIPDYMNVVSELTQKEGKTFWCHIARLPESTYPKNYESVNTSEYDDEY